MNKISKNKEKTCEGCEGKCCKYVVIEIDTPEKEEDFEEIKWFVCHENVFVYIEEDGTWNLEFSTRCKYLNEKNLCDIYPERPETCRKYSQDHCPFHSDYKEIQRFSCIDQVNEYIEKVFKKGLHVIKKSEDKNKEDNKI